MIRNIGILTWSHLINEGVKNMLEQTGVPCSINILESFEKLNKFQNFDVIIISPAVFQNRQNEFVKLKSEFEDTKWVGIVYAHYESRLLDLLDYTIDINDTYSKMTSIIEMAVNKPKQIQHKETLSDREIDVLKLMVNGLSNKEVADQLHISPHTVITHRKNITGKTGIKSLSGLTIYAVLNDFVSLEDFES